MDTKIVHFSADRAAFLSSLGIDPGRWSQANIPEVGVMKERFDGLRRLGFGPQQILKAVKKYPYILNVAYERVSSSLVHFTRYGFTPDEIRKFIVRWASVVVYKPERIDDVWKNLEAYGFTRAQVRKLVMAAPSTLCFTPERTERILRNLESAGIGHERVIWAICKAPTLLCMTTDRTNEGIAVLRDAGFDPMREPKLLLKAPCMLRGRIAFLHAKGEIVVLQHLKISHAVFEKRWGIDRAGIVALDPQAQELKTAPE